MVRQASTSVIDTSASVGSLSQGGRAQPEGGEIVVEDTDLGMEDHAPHGGPTTGTTKSGSRIRTRSRRRNRNGWAKSRASPRPGQKLDRHRARGEQRGDDEGASELGVGGEAEIVREADEADVARPDQPPVVEADPGGVDERDQVDGEQEDQPRQQEPASCAADRHRPSRSPLLSEDPVGPRVDLLERGVQRQLAGGELAGRHPKIFLDVGVLAQPRPLLGDLQAVEQRVSAYGSAARVAGSLSTDARGL